MAALAVQELSVSQDTDVSYRSDELLVLTEKNTSRGEINEMADDAGVDVESVNVLSDGTKMVSIDTQDSDSASVAAGFNEEDKTILVQPNYKYRLSGMSDKKDYGINDTYSNKLWYLGKKENDLEGGSSVEQAWNKLNKSDGQLTQNDKPLVAVIDTGVLFEHEDLGGCLQKDLCVRINEGITTTFSPYDDGDDEGHGTHVSGTIAADKNNQKGTSGIAGNRARLLCVDAMTGSGDDAYFSTQDLCLSIDYAVSKGAKIINMSLGSLYRDHLLERRINDAYNKGTLCICAAGNENTDCIEGPGDAPHAIIVIRDDTGRIVARSSSDFNYWEKIYYGVCSYTAGKKGTFTIEAIEGSLGETLAGREYSLKLTSDKVKANPLVKINNIGALEVSWSAVDGAEGYEVRKYTSAEMNYALNNWTTEGSSIIDTGYYDGQTAYYTVTPYINTVAGILKCGESAPVKYGPDSGKESSEEGSGNGENKNSYTKKIKAPLIVGETYKTRSKSLKVRLSKLDGAKGYKVAYRKAGKRKWKNVSAGTNRTAVIKGARKGQLLEIRAAGISKAGGRQVTGEWSSVKRVCCKNAKIRINRKKRGLNIKFRRDKAAGYRVSYSLSKSFRKSKTITHYSSAKNIFRIHGLKKDRKYYIKYSTVRKYKGKVYQGIMKMKKVK